jgi:hypothetical protein
MTCGEFLSSSAFDFSPLASPQYMDGNMTLCAQVAAASQKEGHFFLKTGLLEPE